MGMAARLAMLLLLIVFLFQDFYKLLADLLAWLANAEQIVAVRDPLVTDRPAIAQEVEKLQVSVLLEKERERRRDMSSLLYH